MTKVNNRKVIRRLALREMKSDVKMAVVVILSIILTCILFTALTAVGGSLINGIQQETMRQVGGNRMAGLKYVLPEDYEKVVHDSAARDVVYRIIIGKCVNEEMKNIYAEFCCAGDEASAEAIFSLPTEGRLPESIDEVALSTIALDELHLPHEIGTAVPLEIDIDGERIEQTFTLCGIWEGDSVSTAQECWLSRAFADKYAPTPTESFYTQKNMRYAGYWSVDYNYANSWNIEGKTEALLQRLYGGSEHKPYFGINWAYTTGTVDSGAVAGGAVLILVIFAAGYLIIYNIFHINISAKIRSYGMLKTIGTTAKQIRYMIRVRAALYSAIGIPLGLVIGMLISRLIMSAVVATLNIRTANSFNVSPELTLMICLISALFTFATVMISCKKPGRIAGGVSPIEALRYNETVLKKDRKDKKTGKITPLAVARSNMTRTRKKTFIVVLSLTLSIVLVNTLYTVLNGFDTDKYISHSIVGDINIRHTDNTDQYEEQTKGITPDMIEGIRQASGEDVHPVYYDFGSVNASGEAPARLKKLSEKYGSHEQVREALSMAAEGRYMAEIYGIDETAAGYCVPLEGSIDTQKLKSGRYAAVYTYLFGAEGDSDVQIYHVGDTISIECGENDVREYEVMAVCEIPYPLSTKLYNIFSTQVMVYTDEYLSLSAEPGAVCVMINTDDDSGSVREKCRAYCDEGGSPLVYADKQKYLDEFDDFIGMVKLVGGILSGILALIGILNFVNAVVTGILSRKRELAMMNAVGMTGEQLKKMLMWEGTHYAVLTAICSAVIGTFISCFAVRAVTGDMFFYTYHFTLVPILVCTVILLIFSAFIPFAAYNLICRESVVERLREN